MIGRAKRALSCSESVQKENRWKERPAERLAKVLNIKYHTSHGLRCKRNHTRL